MVTAARKIAFEYAEEPEFAQEDERGNIVITKKGQKLTQAQKKRVRNAFENAMRIIQELKEEGFVIEPTPLNR